MVVWVRLLCLLSVLLLSFTKLCMNWKYSHITESHENFNSFCTWKQTHSYRCIRWCECKSTCMLSKNVSAQKLFVCQSTWLSEPRSHFWAKKLNRQRSCEQHAHTHTHTQGSLCLHQHAPLLPVRTPGGGTIITQTGGKGDLLEP